MNKVKAIYESTLQIIELLEKASEMDRGEKIKRINEFLEIREQEMEGVVPPYSHEEKEIGRSLVHLNKRFEQLLECEKLVIQRDMKELHAKKISNRKYTNPYENLVTGGVFYDKRN